MILAWALSVAVGVIAACQGDRVPAHAAAKTQLSARS